MKTVLGHYGAIFLHPWQRPISCLQDRNYIHQLKFGADWTMYSEVTIISCVILKHQHWPQCHRKPIRRTQPVLPTQEMVYRSASIFILFFHSLSDKEQEGNGFPSIRDNYIAIIQPKQSCLPSIIYYNRAEIKASSICLTEKQKTIELCFMLTLLSTIKKLNRHKPSMLANHRSCHVFSLNTQHTNHRYTMSMISL